MKAPQLILILLAFGIGAGLVAALKSGGGDNTELEDELAALKRQMAGLESNSKAPTAVPKVATIEPKEEPKAAPSGLSALLDSATAGAGGDEELSAEERIAKLFNSPEARSLMKGFAGAMSGRADQWIGGEVGKYKDKLGLTDAQTESITKRMAAMVQENTKKFQSELDDGSRSMQEIMESQGDFWRQNEGNIEAMLQEELNEDQFAQFQTEQLVERTQRVQRGADRELEAIDKKLELDESQEDQVFSILVRESPEFDEAMAIEGIETTLPPAAVAEDVTKDDAIRSVLTPEQTETYNATVEDGGFTPRRRGPWGGGGFGR